MTTTAHTCPDCGGLVSWADDGRGSCSCSGRVWRSAATERAPNRAPRWRAEARAGRSRGRRGRVRESAELRQRPRRPAFDAFLPRTSTYREHLLACQLAADCAAVPLAVWIRRALAAAAGQELRRRQYRIPRRVLDLAAAGRLEELERLAATLRAGELEEPAEGSAPAPVTTSAPE